MLRSHERLRGGYFGRLDAGGFPQGKRCIVGQYDRGRAGELFRFSSRGERENMKIVTVCKAGAIDETPIEEIHIHIKKECPDYNADTNKGFYTGQAKMLCEALYAGLPRGTINRLLCLMLEKEAILIASRW